MQSPDLKQIKIIKIMIYTIEEGTQKIDIVVEHVVVIYEMPRVNLLVLDNGHEIEITNEQRDEIKQMLE